MTQINVIDQNGKQVSELKLSDDFLAGPVRKGLIYQAINRHLANRRAGTHSTQTRGEMSGTTRKIVKQKGSGGARHGDNRAPIFVGGGVAFGPKPRDYSFNLPKQARKQALRSALLMKQKENNLIVVNQITLKEFKTKAAIKVLQALDAQDALLILDQASPQVEKSFANIPHVQTILADNLNLYDVLNHNKVVFTEAAIKKIQEKLALN